MAQRPRANLLDLTAGRGTNQFRQAQRDSATVDYLAHIDEGIGALVELQREQAVEAAKQTQLLTDIAGMLWRIENRQPST